MNYVQPIKSTADLENIIDYLRENNFAVAVVFMLGIYSGLRVSDILNLNIRNVEDKNKIIVREQKTGKYKKFPIKPVVKDIVNQQINVRLTAGATMDDPLVIGVKGSRLHRSMVYRGINEACQACGVSGEFGTHTMRKTFGYHHYQQNHDVALLQKIFNHSSPGITLRYIGIEQEEINESYNNFEYCKDYEYSEDNSFSASADDIDDYLEEHGCIAMLKKMKTKVASNNSSDSLIADELAKINKRLDALTHLIMDMLRS